MGEQGKVKKRRTRGKKKSQASERGKSRGAGYRQREALSLSLSRSAIVREMVFGLSYGEVLLLMVGTVVLLGPKDMHIMARAAGRITGKAVGYVQTMRGQVDTIMNQSQASNLQKELREAMSQLDAIRHEVRTGMSIMQPKPFVRESLENHGSGLQQATKLVHKIEKTLDRFVDSTDTTKPNAHAETPFKSSAELQRQATSYARFAGHFSAKEKPESGQGVGLSVCAHQATSSEHNAKEIPVLPISAVSMGLFPTRTGPLQGGSDLMLESLAERKVAQQALEFLQEPNEQLKTST